MPAHHHLTALFLSITFLIPAFSQERVLSENLGERVIAVVPLIGNGSRKDPMRPLFVPGPDEKPGANPFTSIIVLGTSDDGKSVIVEFVAHDRKILAPIENSGRADVKTFVRGKDKKEDIDRELKRVKRDIDLDKLLNKR
jgi:hypothetical protein